MSRRRNVSEELLERANTQGSFDSTFAALMSVSGVLTAVAMLANSIPILIGAMVVAPAYNPLARFVVTIAAGERRQALRAFATTMAGLTLAVAAASLTAWLIYRMGVSDRLPLDQPLLEERVRPGWYSMFSALAAGIAGAIATIKKKLDTLIGTVAAVALVPAGGAAGISLVGGEPLRALGGFVLLGVNILAIVGMGLLVVAVSRPRTDRRAGPAADGGA